MVGEQSLKLSPAPLSNALSHLVAQDSAPIAFELVSDFIHVMLCYAIVEDTNACLFEKKKLMFVSDLNRHESAVDKSFSSLCPPPPLLERNRVSLLAGREVEVT